MNVSEALEARRSVRYFGDREVPEETLRSIVKDAQWAPSWANAQPWKVYIATGSRALEIRENHRGIAEPGLKGHSDLAAGHREDWGERACANMARLGSEVMGFLGDDGNQIADCQRDLFDAPAIVYLTMHKGTPDFGKLDMGGFAQSLMLSAREHGVDSVIAYEFVRYPEEARKFMGIPDDEAVVIGIGLGYADERKINSFRSSRAPLDEVLIVKS